MPLMHSPETSLTVLSKAVTKVSCSLLIEEYAALRRVNEPVRTEIALPKERLIDTDRLSR